MKLPFEFFVFGIFLVHQASSFTKKEAVHYFWSYRHLNTGSPSRAQYKEGLRNFQRYTQILVTGNLDRETKNMMNTPRCFNPNERSDGNDENRVRRYTFFGTKKWAVDNLNYYVEYSNNVDKNLIDEGLKKAFDMWSRYSGLKFTKGPSITAPIRMRFAHIEQPTTLGYAYQVSSGRIIHSNRPNWTRGTPRGTNFFIVALHEIRHALGIDHTNVKKAIMFPFLVLYDPNYHLHADDIDGIKAIYRRN